MDYSIALSYVFKDKEWLRKIAIGGFVSFFSFIFGVFLVGYYLEVLRFCLEGKTERLPEWSDVGKLFVDGILGTIIALVYLILIGGLCAMVIVALCTTHGIPQTEMVLGIVFVSIVTLYGLIIFINIGWLKFAQTNNLGAAFNLVDIFPRVKKRFTDLLAISSFVLILQSILLCAGFGLLSPFANFWGWLVQANLFAQCEGIKAEAPAQKISVQ